MPFVFVSRSGDILLRFEFGAKMLFIQSCFAKRQSVCLACFVSVLCSNKVTQVSKADSNVSTHHVSITLPPIMTVRGTNGAVGLALMPAEQTEHHYSIQ